MSAESLSPSQVENLVKVMETAQRGDGSPMQEQRSANSSTNSSTGASSGRNFPAGAKPNATSTAHSQRAECEVRSGESTPAEGPQVTPYDFKHPDRIGKNQQHALWSLHESIANHFAAAISRLLRAPLEVKLISVDQFTYREFAASRVKPSCLSVFRPTPLDGIWSLDIAPSLAFAMIDRMLGGDPVPGVPIRRPLTEIENRLMSRVVALFLEQIGPAWEPIVTLHPEQESMVSTPHRAPAAPPDEAVIQIEFAVRWGKNSGSMTLCIPHHTIEPYLSGLVHPGVKARGDRHVTDATRRQIAQNIDAANVDVVVTLARSRIKTSDLMGLTVGDIIATEQQTDHPLELAIQNIPKFHASAGAYQGKKAVQVQSVIEPGRRGNGSGDAPHNLPSYAPAEA